MKPFISFEADISSLQRALPDWAQNRIPSITRNALNDVAKAGRFAEMERIRGVFDRPTPLVQRSPLYREATKDNLVAEVYVRDEASRGGTPPSKILAAEVRGGARRPKAFELLLRRAGIMRADEFAVPARDTPRDSYGNIQRSVIVRIVSQMGKRRRGGLRYFVPKPGAKDGLARGVWEEYQGRRVRPVIVFVRDTPRYGRRYPFGDATIAEARRKFGPSWKRHFDAELAKQMSR